MNTTALVHEAYVKLVGKKDFESRAHVLATASRAMRQVLVSYAEARNAQKRGGSTPDLPLDEAVAHLLTDNQADDVLALNDALAKLSEADERAARIVECRYFGGLSVIETAEALDVSEATVTRGWRARGHGSTASSRTTSSWARARAGSSSRTVVCSSASVESRRAARLEGDRRCIVGPPPGSHRENTPLPSLSRPDSARRIGQRHATVSSLQRARPVPAHRCIRRLANRS